MSHGEEGACCGGHKPAVSSVHQTLAEMEFERGIWSAALDNDTVKVKKYLSSGGNVNAIDSSGYTALHYAARYGHKEMCQLLLDHGARVNSETRSGHATPLHRAAYCGHGNTVELLIRRGADVTRRDADGATPLHKACERGHVDTAAKLLCKNKLLNHIEDNKQRKPIDYVNPENILLLQLLQPT